MYAEVDSRAHAPRSGQFAPLPPLPPFGIFDPSEQTPGPAGGRIAKYWRKPHYRNGKLVKGHWVSGSNPKAGCAFLMVGMVSLAALARAGSRR